MSACVCVYVCVSVCVYAGGCGGVKEYIYCMLELYILVPKGAHARGYALQLKIKPFLFEMLCCVLA